MDSFYKNYLILEKQKEENPDLANILNNSNSLKIRLDLIGKQVDVYVHTRRIDSEVASELKRLLGLIKKVI